MKIQIAAFLCLVSGFLVQNSLNAQSYLYQIGNPTFSTQIPIENGFINVNNGEIHMEIPLSTHPQRGSLQLDERLVYDSRIWKIVQNGGYSWQPTNVPNSMGGWTFSSGAETGSGISYYTTSGSQSCGGNEGTQPYYIYWGFAWTDPQGTAHTFYGPQTKRYTQSPSANCTTTPTGNPTASGYASDGSGYSVKITNYTQATIYDKQGNVYLPGTAGATIQDRNGNYWSRDSNGNLVDTVGRTPLKVSTSGNLVYYDVLGEGGANQRYTVTTETVNFHTSFNQTGVTTEGSGSFTAIQSIQLPDGSSYSFTYDSGTSSGNYGELTSVTLPTGGVIQYGYTNFLDSFQNQNRWVNTRLKDGGTTTFTPATISNCSSTAGCQEKVTVTSPPDSISPSGNATVYTFNLDSGAYSNAGSWNAGIDVYQGLSTSGPHLRSSASTYSYQTDYIEYGATYAGTYLQVIRATTNTTLPAVGLSAQTTTSLDYAGNPTSVKQWDYYSGSAPVSPTLETDYTYGYAVNNAEFPTQITVKDGSGNQVSQTTYGYDETTGYGHAALATVSGLSQEPLAITGSRGNLTTTSQWLNTSGANISSMATYDGAGTMLSSTDPTGTTTYGHDGTDTFVTSLTPPTPSSGVSLGSSAVTDSSTGLPLNTTDPNGAQVIYSSYDSMFRPTEVDYPIGKTTYSYSPTQVGTHVYQNTTVYQDTETLYDSYGRTSRVAVYNGQSGNDWYQVDYCYNATGLLQFQSVKYQSTGFIAPKQCSGNGTTYAYDALGRVTSSTNADGTASSLYTGRAVETTNVNGVKKITQYDLLGRIMGVCEISSNTLTGSGSPAACGMDIAGTGFLTSYTYNLASHTTTIAQGTQQLPRIFTTDEAGRSIYTSEPERGATSYSYAYNGTGLAVTRVRPQANQPNASVTTTTTTQYDSVGRVVSITYTDGTLSKNYSYDQAVNWGTVPLGASKGRLTFGSVSGTGIQFAYNSMGQVTNTIQCLPDFCGNSPYDVNRSYTYDLAGNLIQDTYLTQGAVGTSVQTNYGYSPAGELTSISDTRTGNIISNMQNSPFGPTSYQFGNGLGDAVRYDGLGRVNAGWVCSNSAQYNCSGGTQVYGFNVATTGTEVVTSCDYVCYSYGYDEFKRLASATIYYGTTQNFAYVYDRYGNRWQQNVTQGTGPSPNVAFNTANNRITTAGYAYDAAGNMTNDGFHSYTYDAEGNILKVDNGSTANYWYDAFNHRVQSVVNGIGTGYAYNLNGQRVATFTGSGSPVSNQIYWGSTPVAFYNGGQIHYQHQNWMGTERMQTSSNGSAEGSYQSLPWGDGYNPSGTNNDPYHFAQLDNDTESWTDHAQFRQYSSTQGRWMSPDPYNGSMDPANPQSFNRYAYVLNNPLGYTDPTGLAPVCITHCGETPPPNDPTNNKDNGEWYDPVDWPSMFLGLFSSGPKINPNWNVQRPNKGIDCSQPPPAVPLAPPGVDTEAKVANLFELNYDPTGVSMLYSAFQTGGPLDYKQLSSAYTDYGNFLYGAACQALNGSSSFCHGAAGLNRDYRALRRGLPLGSGVPFVSGLMGDQARDFSNIQNGINYQKYQKACKGSVF